MTEESNPWYYLIWRFGNEIKAPYPTREEAWEACAKRIKMDIDEYVEGVFDPEGNFVGIPEIEY